MDNENDIAAGGASLRSGSGLLYELQLPAAEIQGIQEIPQRYDGVRAVDARHGVRVGCVGGYLQLPVEPCFSQLITHESLAKMDRLDFHTPLLKRAFIETHAERGKLI